MKTEDNSSPSTSPLVPNSPTKQIVLLTCGKAAQIYIMGAHNLSPANLLEGFGVSRSFFAFINKEIASA